MSDKRKYYNMLCKLLKTIKLHSDSKWKEVKEQNLKEYRKAIITYDQLITEKPPIVAGEITQLANEYVVKDFFELNQKHQYYYLPPLTGDNSDFVPFLSFTFDYRDDVEAFCLRIGLRKIEKNEDEVEHFGVGFRYETAHKTSMKHNYAHSQFVLKPNDEDLPNCPSWLPEKIPCIPTPAVDPISTFLIMLVSLYGKREWIQYVNDIDNIEDYYLPLKHAKIIQ